MKVIKFLSICLLVAFLLTAGLLYGAKGYLQDWSHETRALAAPVLVEFPRGTKLAELAADLERKGLVTNSYLFQAWVRFFENYGRFQAGTYKFEDTISPRAIVSSIRNGEVFVPVVLSFTIPEGFTVKQIAARLAELDVAPAEEMLSLSTDPDFLKKLGVPSSSLEGFLYPATYQFSEMPTAAEALGHLVKTFFEKLPANYEANVQAKGLSLEEAVAFASLIELETRLDEERPLVSEVIWNRLGRGMPLGIDASIIYGIPDYDGNIRSRHLKDASNRYNTRIHLGLPPTAIGSPARASLEAVLTPAQEGNLYYVLDPEDGTRHIFTKSFRDHQKYVRKLVRYHRERRRKGQ